jgi:hypothetical protein
MSKTTITRLFVGATAALVVGFIVALVTLVAALLDGVVSIGGPTVVTVDGEAFDGALVWLLIAALVSGAGAVVGVASWLGALFNTVRLEDKTWFLALLVLGLFSFGWIAMAAYVIAGPDATIDAGTDLGVFEAGQA